MVKSSPDLPDCIYENKPILVAPNAPTPNHYLYLSNLDDQKFLRFSIKYLYVYKKGVDIESLKSSLARVLVDYYPLAGRLRVCKDNEEKLEVDCNGDGAVFAQGFMDITSDDFLEGSNWPNISWRKLLYRVDCYNTPMWRNDLMHGDKPLSLRRNWVRRDYVDELVNNNVHHGVKLVQEARTSLTDDYVRSVIDYLEENRVKPDLRATLVISPWSKLGLEDLDFGEGKPLHMGPLVSEIYCLFVPVVGNVNSVKVVLSVPESVAKNSSTICTICVTKKARMKTRCKESIFII
ncbi:hypothetical protein GIB67_041359 [Kingdonia uniflora]|uniref:Uncharacterized protein n=1 Tax=Kingdonia uniflora TaxID=39325 RepID=A0A7J7NJF4_9MAGN|nr:hypothetical protein GIB67_041359 [Kingdonia uniflora]